MNKKPEILQNFIVLEGLDGSGTTTQLNLVGDKLTEIGHTVFKTCEPSNLATGRIIRKVLEKEIIVEPATLARMFSADRNEHLYNKSDGIIKHLDCGEIVISDRYLFSSLAYQSIDTNFDFVKSLNNFPLPEFLFFIELNPKVCKNRMDIRGNEKELFEIDSIQDKIINNYEKAMSCFSDTKMRIFRLDGSKSQHQICSEIIEKLSR